MSANWPVCHSCRSYLPRFCTTNGRTSGMLKSRLRVVWMAKRPRSQAIQRRFSFSAHAKDIWTTPDWEKREKLAACDWLVTCTAAGVDHLAALAADPAILIADEPTAEVDSETECQMIELIVGRKHARRAALIATHSMALAATADRVYRIADGRIVGGES